MTHQLSIKWKPGTLDRLRVVSDHFERFETSFRHLEPHLERTHLLDLYLKGNISLVLSEQSLLELRQSL